MKYWVFQNNQVCGPYDPEELGRLPGYSLESFVCPEGKGSSMGDWRLASLIPELAPAAEQKAAQAPAFSPEDISLLNALQEKVALLESTAIQFQDSLGAKETELFGLRRELDSRQAAAADIQVKIQGLGERLAAMAQLRETVDGAVTAGKNVESSVKEVKSSVTDMSATIKELEGALQYQRQTIADLIAKFEASKVNEPAEAAGSVQRSKIFQGNSFVPPVAAVAPTVLISKSHKKTWLTTSAVFIVIALGAFVFWRGYRHFQQPAHQAFFLPYENLHGLEQHDGKLFTGDIRLQMLISFNRDGKLEDAERLDNHFVAGLCWADGTFWSTEKGRDAIYQHGPGPEHSILRIYATPNRKPLALCSDGDNIWAGDGEAAMVYNYLIEHSLNGTSLIPLKQYPLPGAAAFCASNGLLWVLDSKSRLSRYRYDAWTLAAVDGTDLSAWLTSDHPIVGLAAAPPFLWALASSPATLHRFDTRQLHWEPAAERLKRAKIR